MARDDLVASNVAVVVIEVVTNHAPVAADDAFGTFEDTPVGFAAAQLLANDVAVRSVKVDLDLCNDVVAAGGIARVASRSGAILGDLKLAGALGTLQTREGGLQGDVTALTMKTINVRGGDVTGTLRVACDPTLPGADARDRAIRTLRVRDGGFSGTLLAAGELRNLKADRIEGATVQAGALGTIRVSADLVGSSLRSESTLKRVIVGGDILSSAETAVIVEAFQDTFTIKVQNLARRTIGPAAPVTQTDDGQPVDFRVLGDGAAAP